MLPTAQRAQWLCWAPPAVPRARSRRTRRAAAARRGRREARRCAPLAGRGVRGGETSAETARPDCCLARRTREERRGRASLAYAPTTGMAPRRATAASTSAFAFHWRPASSICTSGAMHSSRLSRSMESCSRAAPVSGGLHGAAEGAMQRTPRGRTHFCSCLGGAIVPHGLGRPGEVAQQLLPVVGNGDCARAVGARPLVHARAQVAGARGGLAQWKGGERWEGVGSGDGAREGWRALTRPSARSGVQAGDAGAGPGRG